MNYENEYNKNQMPSQPYKASNNNLNTRISNPDPTINNVMNSNIQNATIYQGQNNSNLPNLNPNQSNPVYTEFPDLLSSNNLEEKQLNNYTNPPVSNFSSEKINSANNDIVDVLEKDYSKEELPDPPKKETTTYVPNLNNHKEPNEKITFFTKEVKMTFLIGIIIIIIMSFFPTIYNFFSELKRTLFS